MNTLAPFSVEEAEQRVLGWQTKLHRWADQDKDKRFGDLFNLVCDPATLLVAWERVKRNRGSRSPGVDGMTRKRVEAVGVEVFLSELRESLRDRTFTARPVREREIPKRGTGKTRKLGIPTLRDRIVQMAVKLVLEPIMEADFCPISYGFRPGRRTQDAIEEVRHFINPPVSYEWVIEGDVQDCFGSIHHGLLISELRRRVTDKRVLALVRQFLGAGVMRELGTLAAMPSGTPQGAIISPLLANVALSVLDRHLQAAWDARTAAQRARGWWPKDHVRSRIVRYADDFVILVRGTEAQAQTIKEQTAEFMAEHMRLTLSPEKTAITHVDDGFDFLGQRVIRRARDGRLPAAYNFPSQQALGDIKHRIKELTGRHTTSLSLDELVHTLNPILRGWTNYHRHAASSRCFNYLDYYLWWRIVRWLRKKHKRLTWTQVKRRYWGHNWTTPDGTRLYWPGEVKIRRYRYRGYRIASPWATNGETRFTDRAEVADT